MPQRNPFNRSPRDVGSIFPPSTPYDQLTLALTLLTDATRLREIAPEADPATVRSLLDQIEGQVAALRAQWPRAEATLPDA